MIVQNEAYQDMLDDAKACNYRAGIRDGVTKDSAEGHQERVRQVEQYIRDNPGSLTPEIAREMLKLGISQSSLYNILNKLVSVHIIRREFRRQDVLPYKYAVYFPGRA